MSEINLGQVVGPRGPQGIQGIKGDKGDKGGRGDAGLTGQSGTITSASATTLAEGATATVSLGGSTTARTFAFGIPKGATGAKGAKGDKGDKGDSGGGGISSVATITSLKALPSPSNNSRMFVDAVGKEFVFSTNNSTPVNSGTVFQGVGGKWEMVTQSSYCASWFATPDVQTNQAEGLQTGYVYATSKGRPYVIDGVFYASETNSNAALDVFNSASSKTVINLLSNSVLSFTKNGKINLLTTTSSHYCLVMGYDVENVIIIRPNLNGDLLTHPDEVGEYGHGLVFYTCENVHVIKPTITNMFGDGLYIGLAYGTKATTRNCKNILIENALIDRARRNGISFSSGDNIRIVSPYVKNIHGTAPESGIDIEPEDGGGANERRASITKSIIDSATFEDTIVPINFNIFGDREVGLTFSGTTLCTVTENFSQISTGINIVTTNNPDDMTVLPNQKGYIYIDNLVFMTEENSTAKFHTPVTDASASGLPVTIDKLRYEINDNFVWRIRDLSESHIERKGVTVNQFSQKEERGFGIWNPPSATVFSNRIFFDDNMQVDIVLGTPKVLEFSNKSHISGWMMDDGKYSGLSKHMIPNVMFDGTSDKTINTSGDARRLNFKVSSFNHNTVSKLTLTGVNYKGLTSISSTANDCAINLMNTATSTEVFSSFGGWSFDSSSGATNERTETPLKFWVGTQAQYDAVSPKDSNTLYHVV